MTVQEYVANAKKELDDFEKMWVEQSEKNEFEFRKELDEEEWVDQEIAYRFEMI